jgi:phage FluMu gp28-like protein
MCELNKLEYFYNNQHTICAELYNGLHDAMLAGECNTNMLGRRVNLPASHSGSPRLLQQLYQDSMAIVRRYSKPTLFITITANPN